MNEHGAGVIGDNFDILLGHVIFPVCTFTAEGMVLPTGLNVFAKIRRCKYTIVGPNMFDRNVVAICKRLESFFGLQCFFGCGCLMEMTIKKLGMMINPKSEVLVLVIRCSAGLKRYVAANARDRLVH